MPLAIVSALLEEQAGLRQRLENPTEIRLANRVFLSGQIAGQSVVLVLCGIGKVAAAITTTLLIQHFGVQRILFTGVAGGLHDAVQVGDVVVATELLQHDMDASPIVPKHVVPLIGLSRMAADPGWGAELLRTCEQVVRTHPQWQSKLSQFRGDERVAQVHAGLIVSGDQFIRSPEQSHALREALPDALAVEMEGAAVAQVCHDHGLPFAVIRTVSDRADASAHVDFLAFVREVASPCSEWMVMAWLEQASGVDPLSAG